MTDPLDESFSDPHAFPGWWPDFAEDLQRGGGTVVALTGAGLSAESGLPTFRGREGYWTLGAREYTPQQMATWAMFAEHPEEVWRWYLDRARRYRRALPNAGHEALARCERLLADRFHLVTQNVDGLHERAGCSAARTSEVHGNLGWMRCSRECQGERWRLPDELTSGSFSPEDREATLTEAYRNRLRCPNCGSWARPHVLWFDEYYDDVNYDATRAMTKSREAALLLVIGTSGATNLPLAAARQCLQAGGRLLEINPERTPFTQLAEQSGGHLLRGPATRWLPEIVRRLEQTAGPTPPRTPD